MSVKYDILFHRYATYSDEEIMELKNFLFSLANATYGTFRNVSLDSHGILPTEYLHKVHFLKSDISYTVSNSHVDIASSFDMVPTITELGMCYTYNGEIASYNDYK